MIWIYIASLLTGFTATLPIFGGGKSVAVPLLNSSLADEPKYTSYNRWHMVSIIAMAIGFLLAAFNIEL